jgi:hypothetical protein
MVYWFAAGLVAGRKLRVKGPTRPKADHVSVAIVTKASASMKILAVVIRWTARRCMSDTPLRTVATRIALMVWSRFPGKDHTG